MRVLITGAAGAIGRVLVAGLKERYALRGFDRVEVPDLADTVVGDLGDLPTLRHAAQGMDAIIHLAAAAGGQLDWERTLHNNIIGTYHLFEAARENGVPRIAFASRAGLLSPYPEELTRTIDLPPKPESYYSVSKAFGEHLGYMYAARFDLQVVCVRIGNFKADRPHPEHPHHLGHRDCVRVFERAIIHPGVKFEVVFGVSASNWPLYDLEHGRKAIGYDPIDYAHVDSYPGASGEKGKQR